MIQDLHDSTFLFILVHDISEVCQVYRNNYAKSVEAVIDEFKIIQAWYASNNLRLNSEKTKAFAFVTEIFT